MSVYQSLLTTSKEKGAGYFVLVDPDKIDGTNLPAFAQQATEAGVDAFEHTKRMAHNTANRGED